MRCRKLSVGTLAHEDRAQRTGDLRHLLAGGGPAAASAAGGPADGDVLRPAKLGEDGLAKALKASLQDRRPPAYLAVQAFIAPTPERDAAIARIRTALGKTTCATTGGYGPRFLHSTGQLHKGGPATGWFLQLTSDHPADRPIPGWPYTFGELIDAQARGDREAIRAHDRPVVHVHLGTDADADLRHARASHLARHRLTGGSVPCSSGSSVSVGWARICAAV